VVIVDLGCGPCPFQGAIGIDIRPEVEPDIVADIEKDGIPLPDDYADLITSNHFMEHVTNLDFVFAESWRVLKKNTGHLRFRVPYVQYQGMFIRRHQLQLTEKGLRRDMLLFHQHFTDIEYSFEYDENLLGAVRRVMPQASLRQLRVLFWNVCTDMTVKAQARGEILSREEAIRLVQSGSKSTMTWDD